MNRPIKPVAGTMTFEDYMVECGEWEKDIEMYCDELEAIVNSVGESNGALARYIQVLEKMLDKLISFVLKEPCLDRSERYKPNYYMVCEECEHKKLCNVVIKGNYVKLKNHLMKEVLYE